MKKLLLASAIMFSGIAFTSCSDDDDVSTPANELVGTWKAEFLTYEFGGHGGTYPYDHEIFKQGCATDYLKIEANHTAVLTENNRIEEDCEDVLRQGTWTNDIITIEEENRIVSSVNNEKLVLVYPLTMMDATVDVTVEYSRQ